MAFEDYRLNAQVRALLVRRNVDLSKLEHGVTNQVIYIRGSLRPYFSRVGEDLTEAKMNEVQLVTKLERLLRGLGGVKDVVFHLDRVEKVGWRWRSK